MNHLKQALIIIGCIIAFSSCNDEGYSVDKTYVAMATVVPNGDNSFYLVLDDGSTLWDISGYSYTTQNKKRIIADFFILSGKTDQFDHNVKIRRLYDVVLTKEIIGLTLENDILVGNDPVKILRYWIGDNYLNIEFALNRGAEELHSINMVENHKNINNGTVHLEFRHNANGDPALNKAKGYAAFNLRPYKMEGKDEVDFVIKVNDFDGVKEYNLRYKFGKKTNESSLLTIENINTDATLYK